MPSKPPVCHHCGKPVPRAHGGDLTCGKECRQRYAKARERTGQQLQAAGFIEHAELPGLWAKDGVHISIDQVIREGLKETLARHAAVVD